MTPVRTFSELPAEEQILLACARTELSQQEVTHIRGLVQKDVDWDLLIRLAHRNGIQPLLFLSLNNASSDLVPETTMKRLSDFYLQNSGHNLFLAKELSQLLSLFQSHQIRALSYKGPAMTVDVYGNLAYRQFGDLDLLVEKPDVLRAKEMLVASGYIPRIDLTVSQEKNYLRFQSSFDFVRGNTLVDMHWEIAPRCYFSRIDVKALWNHLVRVTVNNIEMRTVSPADLLLILCVDASRELWERLGRVCDISQLLRVHSNLDWDRLFLQAERIGCTRMLLVGCAIANNAFSAPLPPEISKRIRLDTKVPVLATKMIWRLLEKRKESTLVLEDSRFQPLYLKMRERTRDKLRYSASLLFTPHVADWKMISLPGFLFFSYYLIRPFRIAFKFGSRIYRRYFGGGTERLKT